MEKQKRKLLFETECWRVRLAEDQTYLGYSVVGLKRQEGEKGALSDLTEDEWMDFYRVIQFFETALHEVFGATMFNWMCNMNGFYRKESSELHLHWHVYPRYDHPVHCEDEIFEDPNFGHRVLAPKECDRIAGEDMQEKIICKIREYLPRI